MSNTEHPTRASESPSKVEEALIPTEPTVGTDQRIERGLMAVASFNGNCRKASAFLKEDGIEISHQTLWNWSKRYHTDRYLEMRADLLPKIRSKAAEDHRALSDRLMSVQDSMIDRLSENVSEIDARDLPGSVRNLSVSVGIHTEKAELLSDQAIPGTEGRSVEELLRGLAGRGLQLGERRQEADGSVTERVAVVEPEGPEA